MTMGPKGVRAKGKRYEREIATKLSKALDIDVARIPCSGALQGWKGDLQERHKSLPNSGILDPYCIELKCQQHLNWWNAIKQARSQAGSKEWLLVVSRAFEGADYVMMDLNHFIELLLRAKQNENVGD